MLSDSQLSDFGFELLHGLVAHAPRAGRQYKPQEFVTVPVGRNARFLGTETQSEILLEGVRDKVPCLLRLLGCVGDHDKIVGVSREAVSGVVEGPVEMVEDDVRQQGGDNSSLRGSDFGRFEHAIFHHSSREKAFHQSEDVAVGHLGRNRLHDDPVRNVVEEPLYVGIQDCFQSLAVEFQDPLDGHVAVAVLNKPKR